MEKGNIAKWVKKEGDEVVPGDILAEVETDKATVDFEMQEEGYIAKLLVEEGAKDISIGQLVAILVENKEDIAKFKDYKPTQDKPASTSPSKEKKTKEEPKKEEKKETNKEDSKKVKKEDTKEQPEPKKSKETKPKTTKPAQTDKSTTDLQQLFEESKRSIPQYHVTMECTIDNLIALCGRYNQILPEKISLNDILVKAVAITCKAFPDTNASWTDANIREYEDVSVNLVLQRDGRAIAPLISEVDQKGVSQIAKEIRSSLTKSKEENTDTEVRVSIQLLDPLICTYY